MITFKSKASYLLLSIIGFAICVCESIVFSIFNRGFILGYYHCFLLLASMVLLLIANYETSISSKVKSILQIIVYFINIYLSAECVRYLIKESCHVFLAFHLWEYSLLMTFTIAFAVASIVFLVIGFASFIILLAKKNDSIDSFKLLKTMNALFLIAAIISSAFFVAAGVSMLDNAVYSNYGDAAFFNMILYTTNLLFSALIVFFMGNSIWNVNVPLSDSSVKESDKHISGSKYKGSLDESQRVELLKSYKDLLDKGIITQAEFDKEKAEILSL